MGPLIGAPVDFPSAAVGHFRPFEVAVKFQ
jgi:hypothetical protein